MSPLERLTAEAVPDGTFGQTHTPTQPWTAAEQDAHWNTLANAIGATGTPRPNHDH